MKQPFARAASSIFATMNNDNMSIAPSAAVQESAAPITSVESVKTVKIPPFWRSDPALWFAQVEAQFHTTNTRSDSTKYFTVIAALDCTVLQQVSDLIAAPPAERKYESLKTQLIAAFSDSKEKQFRQLLTELELGDQRPTQLLRHMKTLADGQVNNDLLRTLWLQRRPTSVQLVLSVSEGVELAKMAEIAYRIIEVSANNPTTIASVTDANPTPVTQRRTANETRSCDPCIASELTALQQQVCALTKLVEDLQTNNRKQRQRSRSRKRLWSRTSTNQLQLHLNSGKLEKSSSIRAVSDDTTDQSRLLITDKATGMRFLIDTGADVSVIPNRHAYKRVKCTNFKLYAANVSIIDTYGDHLLCLNLGFRRPYKWRFVVANVSNPIIGADFLRHHKLLID